MMQNKDYSQRFIFENYAIRGESVHLERSYQTLLSKNAYPLVVQRLLGELVCAAVMLSSMLKFKGHLAIHAKSEGPVQMLVAECSESAGIRAVAHLHPDASFTEHDSLHTLLPEGILVISIQPAQGRQYQGVVPLTGDALSHCLELYFQQSEQLATRIYLTANGETASGLLLQHLPSELSVEDTALHWQHATVLADTVRDAELLELSTEALLRRLFAEEVLRLFEQRPVTFYCRCSREKTEFALSVMERAELEEIIAQKTRITVDCQFCCTRYEFSRRDLDSILGLASPVTQNQCVLH